MCTGCACWGAEVVPVKTGTATLKDAVSEAMREWTSRIADTHYCLGSVMGPQSLPCHRPGFSGGDLQRDQGAAAGKGGRLPDAVLACVGGGSNAIGSFYHFIGDRQVRLIGCEAAGRGVDTPETAATIATGKLGIFHGMKSYFCQDQYGQIAPVYSISAGLDYPGIGPEHAHLHDIGRAEYVPVTDEEAVCAFEYLARTEGIIPAIESAHAVAYGQSSRPPWAKIRSSSSRSRAGAIRTVPPSPDTGGRISMSKIAEAFSHGKAFIPFITCGDPDLETTAAAVRAAVDNGADLIELGIPFSDPPPKGP